MQSNDKPIRVMTVLGTRPEIIRLSRTIPLLDSRFDHVLVNTMQNSNSNLNAGIFQDLGLRKPDYHLNPEGESLATFVGSVFFNIEKIIDKFKPEAFVVLGDTNSALSAIIARRKNVAVYHLEAGNRSFDENVPEEVNRRIIDHTADFNLPYGEHARRNLLNEGFPARRVFMTGSPMKEVLDHYGDQISASSILRQHQLQADGFFLVSAHRQENIDHEFRLATLLKSLDAIEEEFGLPVIVSTHPRTRMRLEALSNRSSNPGIRFIEPFGFFDYMQLQKSAKCVLSDSGTLSEESAIEGFAAVTIRDSMERPEALEAGVLSMVGLDSREILAGIRAVISRSSPAVEMRANVPPEYLVQNFSQRVASVIQSTSHLHHEWLGIRT